MTLRKLAANIAKVAIKKFKTECVLIGPESTGTRYETDVNGDQLVCQLLSGRTTLSPDSGEEMVVFEPVAIFHRSSLQRIPVDGETWVLIAALDPELPDVKTTMSQDTSKSIEGGRSLGVIRLYMSQVKQS